MSVLRIGTLSHNALDDRGTLTHAEIEDSLSALSAAVGAGIAAAAPLQYDPATKVISATEAGPASAGVVSTGVQEFAGYKVFARLAVSSQDPAVPAALAAESPSGTRQLALAAEKDVGGVPITELLWVTIDIDAQKTTLRSSQPLALAEGPVLVENDTDATSLAVAGLVAAGGAAVAKTLRVGGETYSHGSIYSDDSVLVSKNVYVGGDLTLSHVAEFVDTSGWDYGGPILKQQVYITRIGSMVFIAAPRSSQATTDAYNDADYSEEIPLPCRPQEVHEAPIVAYVGGVRTEAWLAVGAGVWHDTIRLVITGPITPGTSWNVSPWSISYHT